MKKNLYNRSSIFNSANVSNNAGGTGGGNIEKGAYQTYEKREDCQVYSELKSRLVTEISHEIRTPVNSIAGMANLLLGERLTSRQRQYALDLKETAESLVETVDCVLDFARISGGGVKLSPVCLELQGFIRGIVSATRYQALSKGLEYTDKTDVAPQYILIDGERLRQILVGIISNAVKYTSEGGVSLSVEIEGDSIVFTVSDTGEGIRKEDIPLAFTPFALSGKSYGKGSVHGGLGLPRAKLLAELMGGGITIDSRYGEGTTVRVTVPYVKSDGGEAMPMAEWELVSAPTARVLLVDDIQTNLTVAAGLLRLCGITADVAMSGREAVDLVGEKDYDIIFMDHMMPEMDGVEAMRLIREKGPEYKNLPIIALTAASVNESRDFLISSGMDDFLAKPLDKDELVAVLRKWLPKDKLEAGSDNVIEGSQAAYSPVLLAVSEIEGINIGHALSRIGGMQDVLEQSVRQVAGSIASSLNKMDGFLSQNNLKDFSVAVHGIKGALANIGAVSYSELAAELEILAKAKDTGPCAVKFTVFADIMNELEIKLNSIFDSFNKEKVSELPEGSISELHKIVAAASERLHAYEADDAIAILDDALKKTYGDHADSNLRRAREAATAFDYKSALTALSMLTVEKSKKML